jgi:hypothetical protein
MMCKGIRPERGDVMPAFAWRKKPKRWPAITRRLFDFSLNVSRDA